MDVYVPTVTSLCTTRLSTLFHALSCTALQMQEELRTKNEACAAVAAQHELLLAQLARERAVS
jgi:hypothetical protein